MSEKFELFESPEFGQVRVIMVDDEPWFVLSDVCRALGLSSPHKVAERLDDDEKGRNLIPTLGGIQEVIIISEHGLYSVILRSDKPKARGFRRWITHEVIPSIMRTGSYSVNTVKQDSYMIDDPAERAERWAQEYREKRRLETQVVKLETKIENDAPMVEFAKALADSDELLTVGEFACIVNQALAVSFTDVSVGRNQMFEILRENGHLLSQKSMRNAPSSFMSKNDYMRIVKVYSDRDRRYNPETRITHSGAMYLFKSLRNQFRKESKRESYRRMF